MKDIYFVLFAREGCIFCKKSEILLKEKNKKFYKKTLDKDEGFTEIWFREEFGKNSTYPRIFKVDNKNNEKVLLGGYNDLKLFLSS